MDNKDLQVLLTDCTSEQLLRHFEGLASPGKLDRVGIELFLLNVPLETQLLFPFVHCWMQQNRYNSTELKQISQAVRFVINKMKPKVREAFNPRVSASSKKEAATAFRRIEIANRILHNALAEPVSIGLRGSEYDYDIEGATHA